jgi:hypothetical protein
MKEHTKTILFTASLALNVTFSVTYLTYKVRSFAGVRQQTSSQRVFLQLDLTPEQRSRFFQLIKARIDTGVQACPPWMRPLDRRQSGGGKHE